MKNYCLVLWSFILITVIKAQDFSLYKKNWMVVGADSLPYRVLLPENFSPSQKYPLVLVLHGSGERGSDNEKQLIHGAQLFARSDIRSKYPAIVVFPQCSLNSYWSNVIKVTDSSGKRNFYFQQEGEPTVAMKLLQQLLYFLLMHYPVESDRVYVGGLSMGGMGTYELVRRNPHVFAAAFAICGGADSATAEIMNDTSWWIFHGAKDDIVSPKFSEQMAEALRQKGANVKFTLYPNANHNSWDAAFAEKELLPWLFSQKKK